MAKKTNEDDEMAEIREHLNRQDKTLQEILHVLKGSIAMGTEGIIHKQKAADKAMQVIISDVAHLQRWKKMMQDTRWKFLVSPLEIFKTVSGILVLAATIVGIVVALKELFEK